MECAVCLDAVSAELDGELDDGERVEMDAHLAICALCRSTAGALRQQHRSLRLRMAEPAPDLSDVILASVPPRSAHRWSSVVVASVAAIAVTAGTGLIVAQSGGNESVPSVGIEVHDARVSTGRAGGVAEVYFYMSNPGSEAVVVDVTTPVADKAELHATEEHGRVSTMIRLAEVGVPGSGAALLSPGGTHVMLVGLKSDVVPGDKVPVTLHLSDDTAIEIAATALGSDSIGSTAG